MRKITKDKYKIEFVDRVLDPVHGFIDLTKVEQEIVQLPIFKRMQSLKQLSLANWVFPGAEHTRYIHSLGVMHIADLMAINLRDVDNKPVYNDGDRQLIRLAGLLHDIGHYPLSHVTEGVYTNNNLLTKDASLLSHNTHVKKKIDGISESNGSRIEYMKARYTKPMHHETLGASVIQSDDQILGIINHYCPFIDVKDIQDIIVGCVDRNPNISAMVQLIHSEVDADGIDYIMRDSSFSGTSYGGFELGLLLRNLRVDKYNGIDIVGVRPKGISVVDQYLISKYFSYTQVIFNKHVSILGVMAEMLTHALVRLDASTYPTAESLQKYIDLHSKGNDTFLKFTDRTFWAQLDLIDAQKQLKGIVPDHVLKIFECLSEYRELPSSENRETVVTSSDISSVSETLKQTEIYKDLVDEKEDKLVLFHERGFTAQIPQEMFKDKLIGLNGKEIEDDEFKRSNTARLQEGVAIISKGEEVKLLVDDDRSMMSHLYNTKTYILREYDVNK